MAATIRLMRFGKRKKRDGAYLEKIGLYRPFEIKNNILIEKSRFDYWIEKGAELSEGLQRLLKNKKQISYKT